MHDAAVLASCDWECLLLACEVLHLHVVESHREAEVLLLIFKWFGSWSLEISRGQAHRGYRFAEPSLLSCRYKDVSCQSLHLLGFSTACNTYYLAFFVSG